MLHQTKDTKMQTQQGFTLIELAIVMVIIGFIASAVSVGKSMVESAKARATIADVEKFNSAVAAFSGKYASLPGDSADEGQFNGATRAHTDGRGDGDGDVEPGPAAMWALPTPATAASNIRNQCGEIILFWADLQRAGVLPKVSGLATDMVDNATCFSAAIPQNKLSDYLPSTPWGKGVTWFLARNEGANNPRTYNYLIGKIDTIITTGKIATSAAAPVPVSVTFNIDKKLDDGMPGTGAVQTAQFISAGTAAIPTTTTWGSATAVDTGCTVPGPGATPPVNTRTYDFTATGKGCTFHVRADW